MLKKIFALGLIVGMVGTANSAEPVSFSKWDPECQRLVTRIILSQTFPDNTTITKLKSKLPTLSGGAYDIYQHLIASWSTGDAVSDNVPNNLSELAVKIFSALSFDVSEPQSNPSFGVPHSGNGFSFGFGSKAEAHFVNSAQITVMGSVPMGQSELKPGNYVYDNEDAPTAPCKWHTTSHNVLNATTLQHHLSSIRTAVSDETPSAIATASQNCIHELSRMLLAQIPTADGTGLGPHNVVGNNTPGYTIAAKTTGGHNCDDIFRACEELKEHMLIQGQLGYFPMFSHSNHFGISNYIISRGIFNIDLNIMNRINKSQKQIYNDFVRFFIGDTGSFSAYPHENYPLNKAINDDYLHLFPNIIRNTGFKVDPAVSRNEHPNLEDASNTLINQLLSTKYISNVVIGNVNNNRFTLDVTYSFPTHIPNTTQTKDIAYDLNGYPTNTVKIVVQILNGVISIVTMYPI